MIGFQNSFDSLKRILQINAALLLFGLLSNVDAEQTCKIIKVLPHWLDLQSRHTLSPSLLERDAYQARLRANRSLCSGIRFDVKWSKNSVNKVKLQIELRVTGEAKPIQLVESIQPSQQRGWSSVIMDGNEFKAMGKIIAWRVQLLDGDTVLAEQRSFLWAERKPVSTAKQPATD